MSIWFSSLNNLDNLDMACKSNLSASAFLMHLYQLFLSFGSTYATVEYAVLLCLLLFFREFGVPTTLICKGISLVYVRRNGL